MKYKGNVKQNVKNDEYDRNPLIGRSLSTQHFQQINHTIFFFFRSYTEW